LRRSKGKTEPRLHAQAAMAVPHRRQTMIDIHVVVRDALDREAALEAFARFRPVKFVHVFDDLNGFGDVVDEIS
jgi:hypothetical protein